MLNINKLYIILKLNVMLFEIYKKIKPLVYEDRKN